MMLICSVELARMVIQIKVVLLSQYFKIPMVCQLCQALHIFADLNKLSCFNVVLYSSVSEHDESKFWKLMWDDFYSNTKGIPCSKLC